MTNITCSICGQPNATQVRRTGTYCVTCYSNYVKAS